MANSGSERPNWVKRGAWFIALWLAGVTVVTLLAVAIRSMIL